MISESDVHHAAAAAAHLSASHRPPYPHPPIHPPAVSNSRRTCACAKSKNTSNTQLHVPAATLYPSPLSAAASAAHGMSAATAQSAAAAAAAAVDGCTSPRRSMHLTVNAHVGTSSIITLQFDLPYTARAPNCFCTDPPPEHLAAAAVVAATLPEPLIEPCINAASVAISTALWRMQRSGVASSSTSAASLTVPLPPAAPAPDSALEFGSCFHSLCCRPDSATIIAQVMGSYAFAIQEAQAQRASQLAALQEAQQKEFSRSVLKNPLQRQEAIEAMARGHNQKKKQILASWKDEISQLKRAQRQEFRDFVVQQYAASSSALAALYDPDELFMKTEPLRLWSMQRQDSVWKGDLHVGNRQLGKMLSICVRSGSAGACYGRVRSEEHALEAQVDYAQLLYSHASLAAVHYLSIDGSHRASAAHRELVDACEASCEFHFDSYPDQIAAARAAMQDNFSAGDCVITRHSNLRALHMLFHCIVDTVSSERWSWSRAQHAEAVAPFISKVIQFCCAQGIQSLAVPAFFCENVSKVSPGDAAEALAATLKALRSSFVEFSQHSHVTFLKEVHVLLPPAVVEVLGRDGIAQLISRTIMQ